MIKFKVNFKSILCIILPLIHSAFLTAQTEDSIKYSPEALLNKKVPQFSAQSLSGKLWNEDSLRGKVTLINFWYIGCMPCMSEIVHFNKLREHYKNEDFNLISMAPHIKEDLRSFNDTTVKNTAPSSVRNWLNTPVIEYEVLPVCEERTVTGLKIKDNDSTYVVGPDCDETIKDFYVHAYPTTFIVDKKGVIRYMKSGFLVQLNKRDRGSDSSDPGPDDKTTTKANTVNLNRIKSDTSENKIITEYKEIIDELLHE